jgi:hypothetical protein
LNCKYFEQTTRRFNQRPFERSNKLCERFSDHSAEFLKLDNIDSTLAALAFANERLRLTDLPCKLRLRETRILAREHVPEIVEAWYPGQAGGTALADLLFGDYNPAGRVPVTFYSSANQIPAFDNYSMTGKTYRFFSGEPVFGLGYGLSYTTFGYRRLVTPRPGSMSKPISVSVDVENTGTKAGLKRIRTGEDVDSSRIQEHTTSTSVERSPGIRACR